MDEGSAGARSEREQLEEVFRYLKEFARENHGDARVREVARELELPVQLVQTLLNRLQAQSQHESHISSTHRMPLHYGDVAAGQGVDQGAVEPHESDGTFLDTIDFRDGDFTLRVQGDSLKDVGIEDQDWVLLRPVDRAPHTMNGQIALDNGQVVLAVVWDRETQTWVRVLKLFERRGESIWLKSANPDYPDKSYRINEIAIQAILVQVIRTFYPHRGA